MLGVQGLKVIQGFRRSQALPKSCPPQPLSNLGGFGDVGVSKV